MMQPDQQATAEGILFTGQYQLTMAQLYYRMSLHERPAQFDHFFRSYPDYGAHQAGYCVNAGLEWLLGWMQRARFRDTDLAYLRSQRGRAGQPIFACIPEGRVVHPHEPLTVVQGPLAMAQILETPLLNQLNFQTLIATKAARIHERARSSGAGVWRMQGAGYRMLESGVPHAITVYEGLRRKGHTPIGIRLDSGNLAYLSIQAARMLNTVGFSDTAIVLSCDLDKLVIWQILTQIEADAPVSMTILTS